MAGDWLKFDKSTPDKPEVWQIADALDIDPDAVVGKLMRLWSWMDDHTQDGNAPSVSRKLLDRIVGVTGFCDAVTDAGWLVDDGKNLSAVNFDRHNGKTAKNRALTAKRVAQHKQKSNDAGNDSLTEDALPREEKRREENNKDTSPPPTPDDPIDPNEIANLYNEVLGDLLPSCKAMSKTRKANLRARVKEDAKRRDMAWWRRYFEYIAESPFLTGQITGKDGKSFSADMGWILLPDNMLKVIEGKYNQ